MDLSNISTNKLKKLNIYPDLRDDPLFHAVMRVMSDDICIKKGKYLDSTFAGVLSLSDIWGGLKAQAIYFFVAAIYAYNEWNFASFGSKAILLIFFLISAISNFGLAIDHDKFGTDKWINGIIVVITYILIRFLYTNIFYTVLISMAIQVVVTAVFYNRSSLSRIKQTRDKYLVKLEKAKKKTAEANSHFENTCEMLRERVALCNAELQRRGETQLQPSVWWKKNLEWWRYDYGDIFNDKHSVKYIGEKIRKTYDLRGNVTGERKYSYTLQIQKHFYKFELPKSANAEVFARIRQKKLQPLVSCSLDDFDVDTCKIYAIGCRWISSRFEDVKTTVEVSPTQSQIDDARRDINARRDADERLRNAFEKGAALTTDEIFIATGGEGVSWQEQMISENRRRNDLEKFVKDNTYENVTQRNSSQTEQEEALFMYIINGFVFYSKEPPFTHVGDEYTTTEESFKWIESREEEIVATVIYMVMKEPEISRVIVENIWNAYGETQENEELYCRVLHTLVDSKVHQKYYKKNK